MLIMQMPMELHLEWQIYCSQKTNKSKRFYAGFICDLY